MSLQKAIKAAYECYVYDCSKLGYEEALKKATLPNSPLFPDCYTSRFG